MTAEYAGTPLARAVRDQFREMTSETLVSVACEGHPRPSGTRVAPTGVQTPVGSGANDRFTFAANAFHADVLNASTGPLPCCVVSRIRTRSVTLPASTQDPPLPPL